MCYSDFGESRDKWRIVFYRYPIKSGFKRRSRNAFIQGGKTSTNTAGSQLERQAFPIQFTSQVMSVVVTYLRMNQEGGAMVASTSNSDFQFSERCYANRSNGSPLFYIALGV